MRRNPFLSLCPPELEDEAFLIEESGEMPEVALAESRRLTGPLAPEGDQALAFAAARCYLKLIRRDLDPRNIGGPDFRGLERAAANLARLESFLGKNGWEMPRETRRDLAQDLKAYLREEQGRLEAGRKYASASCAQVRQICAGLGLDCEKWQGLLGRIQKLPAPDFLGLRALAKLDAPGAFFKRRTKRDGLAVVELLRKDNSVLKAAALPLDGPSGQEDPEAAQRLEAVWAALDLPENRADRGD